VGQESAARIGEELRIYIPKSWCSFCFITVVERVEYLSIAFADRCDRDLSFYTKELSMPENINRNEVQTLIKNGAQLVEVLGPREYEWAHLPQAINIPLWKLKPDSISELKRDGSVIVYCNDYQ
jgi:hypothetical protein